MPNTRRLFAFFAANVFSTIILTSSLSVPPTSSNCVIKVCHNKDCTKKGGGEPLLNTFRDLLPAPSLGESPRVSIESSGCLSQCGKGPNVAVAVGNGNEEDKLYFGVEDPTTASAVLDVATGEEYPINLLVAAASISQAKCATSPTKKEKILSSAISALSKDEDPTLLNSFAHAHALYLRADARLEMAPPNIDGAIADAKLASEIAPTERKVWRVLASAEEVGGNIKEAIDAIREGARIDPSFSTKAKKEIERLANL
eukprot:CAMPEP_0172300916 /NCGR_PEP_ID=MMETSP1058-20130122/2915_1 /TAXON_ID=83371 /ORGANISM="Detonula confervacea, Strain CCMP 353" /LENGTH=256 /DNA_ID=CAMNT_0013010863 /DNA_START=54 /DNA_END=824 /DNA_ORIENTATION=-